MQRDVTIKVEYFRWEDDNKTMAICVSLYHSPRSENVGI